ncbi:zf-TFIIB domain-containing protein [Solimonas sp. SE-A11]|uniref:TFIIB-type zinc ribbon-containing protein n=1 Tax=Solimonas sp. SE-A11 TaxID=3054954 RepID=UPI00259D2040|nr:zf-TFIIB domain-containing protein [Solimonas sp. SE-A11]MDM4772083.1 zf-TFIIB domain-containing protein [Solimonas sp. SE-A11]
MLCPACQADLMMTERQRIEIDYGPKCRGVWLDRGELDKIIERSAAPPPRRDDDDYRRHSGYGDHGKHGYRRKSWLGDIFD